MGSDATSSWLWLAGLGALHGVNPGMGWLFAVALGLQERRAGAVWRALPPLAVGHGLAVALAVVVVGLVGTLVPTSGLKWVVALALLLFAIRQLVRHGHPRWGGMRIGRRDLAVWSLLMASAHGAGLMVVPVLLRDADPPLRAAPAPVVAGGRHVHSNVRGAPAGHEGGGHAAHLTVVAGGRPSWLRAAAAVAVHAGAYLFVTGLLAFAVYAWAGLRLLRTAWINLDLVWAGALAVTALLTPFL